MTTLRSQADRQAYVIMTDKKYYIKTKRTKPLEMLYLHFLNNPSIEIDKPITSKSTQSYGLTLIRTAWGPVGGNVGPAKTQ